MEHLISERNGKQILIKEDSKRKVSVGKVCVADCAGSAVCAENSVVCGACGKSLAAAYAVINGACNEGLA